MFARLKKVTRRGLVIGAVTAGGVVGLSSSSTQAQSSAGTFTPDTSMDVADMTTKVGGEGKKALYAAFAVGVGFLVWKKGYRWVSGRMG